MEMLKNMLLNSIKGGQYCYPLSDNRIFEKEYAPQN
jgi:hypothetical protein